MLKQRSVLVLTASTRDVCKLWALFYEHAFTLELASSGVFPHLTLDYLHCQSVTPGQLGLKDYWPKWNELLLRKNPENAFCCNNKHTHSFSNHSVMSKQPSNARLLWRTNSITSFSTHRIKYTCKGLPLIWKRTQSKTKRKWSFDHICPLGVRKP